MSARIARQSILLASLTLMLSACAVGPDYQRPASALPERYARDDAAAARGSAADDAPAPQRADIAFWQGFGDPVLSDLVAQAYTANHDLRIAISRYDAASALLSNARLDRYPTVTAGGQVGHQLLSRDEAFGAPRDQRSSPTSGIAANASWELDLFGRVRRGVEAQRADTEASAADLRAVRVTIAGEVGQSYMQLRGAQRRLQVARDNARNQRETLALVQARVDAGRGSDLDVLRARAQYESTASRIAAYEAIIGVNQHRLAVLTGQPPEALIARLSAADSAAARDGNADHGPGGEASAYSGVAAAGASGNGWTRNDAVAPLPMPPAIDPGVPGDLLRRRPDIAAAEARLHAATARIGVATAGLYPRFTLMGLIGSSTASYDVFREGSDRNLIALGIDWSFLDVGRVRARIAASDADAAGLLASYQQTVLRAAEETENALLTLSRTQVEAGHLRRAADSSAQASSVARARFEAGAIGFFEVLDIERSRLQAEDASADADTRQAVAAVSLYRALAGGWLPGTPQAVPAPAAAASATPVADASAAR
ncbi:TolC family protein [Bordetella genomosp. 13]|uniref:TolC family protein n=1 Tax=Bordetella genomosp. 13 TaxID=463040 RepID=UPI00119C9191|nr:TolC family protein [Bordetella genomosp. 13]